IAAERALNKKVITLVQVLRADVIYHLNATNNYGASVTVPETVLKGLKLDLGGSIISTNASTIAGEGLVWGFLPDQIGVDYAPGNLEFELIKLPHLKPAERKELTSHVIRAFSTQ